MNAAILSVEESQRLFGEDLNGRGIQAVWVEIINRSEQTLWLLKSGTDPDYFSPLEVAWPLHRSFAAEANQRIDEYFDSLSFQNPIYAGTTSSGVLFTNPHFRTKVLNVDLLGDRALVPFTVFLPVPEDWADGEFEELVARFHPAVDVDYQDEQAFRAALEALPCCTTSAVPGGVGGPLNVVLVGSFADIASALARRNYRRSLLPADRQQLLHGMPPQFVNRKRGQAGVPANWLRMWLAPMRFRGKQVILVQAGRPVGGRFRDSEAPLQVHPDVDEVRNLFIQDMIYSGGLAQLGFVSAGRNVAEQQSLESPIHTDGVRAVLVMSVRPRSMSEIEILDWLPVLEQRERAAAKAD